MTPKRQFHDEYQIEHLSWWQRRNRLIKTTVFLLFFLAIGFGGWRLIRLGLNCQAARLAETAQAFQKYGRVDDAKLALETTARLQPSGPPDLIRKLARHCSKLELYQLSGGFYRQLWSNKSLEEEDVRQALRILVALDDTVTLRLALNYIHQLSEGAFLPMLMNADAKSSFGDLPNAETILEEASASTIDTGLPVKIGELIEKTKLWHHLEAAFAVQLITDLSHRLGDRSALPIYLGLLKGCVPWDAQPEWAARVRHLRQSRRLVSWSRSKRLLLFVSFSCFR